MMQKKTHPTEPLSLKANMLWNSAGSLVYFGFQWLLTIAVVRIAGDYEAAGVLALAMAIYNIVNPIAIYRMYTYQVSDVEHENTLGEYLTFRIITVAAAFVIGVIYALFTTPLDAVLPIALFMLWKMTTLHIDTLHATMQLNGRMDYIGKSDAMQGAASFAVFCVVFWLTRSLSIAFVGMIAITAFIGFAYDRPRAIQFEPIKLGIAPSKAKHLFLYCLPIVIATIACSAAPSVPRQYLALSQGEALLGIYASVAAPAVAIQMGASYIYNPLLSTFAQQYADHDSGAFSKLLIKTIGGVIALGIVLGVVLAFAGEWLLVLLFGESIAEHAYLLLPVIGCTFATAILWFLNDLLISVRRFKGVIAGNAVACVVSLATTIPFVDMAGANGVSFVVIAAFAAGIAVLAVSTIRAIRDLKTP